MIEKALILSLMITAIYVLFQQGNLLGWFRIGAANILDDIFGKKVSRYIQKPFWDCLACMSSFWGITLSLILWNLFSVVLLLSACGILILFSKIIDDEGAVTE